MSALRKKILDFVLSVGIMIAMNASAQTDQTMPVKFDVKAYIEKAVEIMKANSLRKHEVDWGALRDQMLTQSSDAKEAAETYDALRLGLRLLGDDHSFLQLTEPLAERERKLKQMRQLKSSIQSTEDPAAGQNSMNSEERDGMSWRFSRRRSPARESVLHQESDCVVPQVVVPTRINDEIEVLQTYVKELQTFIEGARSRKVCGWIVDIRGNGGGNIFPMLAGLAAFFDDGNVVSAIDGDGKSLHFWLHAMAAGVTETSGRETNVIDLSISQKKLGEKARVAVLTDGHTGSSGELVAIAFKGRPNTRFFGMHTAGASTSTDGFLMPDGANLVIATAVDVDRHGVRYPKGVVPDVVIRNSPTEDQVLTQAMKWLTRAAQ